MSLSHDETRRRISENDAKWEQALDLLIDAHMKIAIVREDITQARLEIEAAKDDIEALKILTAPVEKPIEDPEP